MNYEFGLARNGAIIDTTGIDEHDAALAMELFYSEFGYEPEVGDCVVLLSVMEDGA